MNDERKFGFTVGGAFLVLGAALFFWRHRVAAGAVFGGLGLVLVLLAAVASALLTWPNKGWMAFARLLGRVNTMLFLSVVFFLVLTPLGAFLRLVGRDELRRRRAPSGTMWMPYPARVGDPKHFERMF
jgi:hypothetical protein